MKIFLIEDDDYKQQDICDWLNDNYPDLEVSLADSFRGARSILKDQKFDVCILDMNLPSFGKNRRCETGDRVYSVLDVLRIHRRNILCGFGQGSSGRMSAGVLRSGPLSSGRRRLEDGIG